MGSGGRRAVVVIVIALLAGVLAYGVHTALLPPRLTDPDATGEALEPPPTDDSATPGATSTAPSSTGGDEAPGRGVAKRPAARPATPSSAGGSPAAPTRVEVPALGAVLPVEAVGVDAAQAMEIPEDPDVAGWYRFGPDPRAGSGASVISAHTDTAGEVGPLSRLDRLERGDRIRVSVGGERLVYVVRRVDRHAKKALDLDALFSREGAPRLHLVSCGGEWDPRTRSYEDNVIAVATRMPRAGTYADSRDG